MSEDSLTPPYEELALAIAQFVHARLYGPEPYSAEPYGQLWVMIVDHMYNSTYESACAVLMGFGMLQPFDESNSRMEFTCVPDEFGAKIEQHKEKPCSYDELISVLISILEKDPPQPNIQQILARLGVCDGFENNTDIPAIWREDLPVNWNKERCTYYRKIEDNWDSSGLLHSVPYDGRYPAETESRPKTKKDEMPTYEELALAVCDALQTHLYKPEQIRNRWVNVIHTMGKSHIEIPVAVASGLGIVKARDKNHRYFEFTCVPRHFREKIVGISEELFTYDQLICALVNILKYHPNLPYVYDYLTRLDVCAEFDDGGDRFANYSNNAEPTWTDKFAFYQKLEDTWDWSERLHASPYDDSWLDG